MTVKQPLHSQKDGMVANSHTATEITIIEPRSGWQLIDWRELWRYRDLFFFLVLNL